MNSEQTPDSLSKVQWRTLIRQDRAQRYQGLALAQSAREIHPHLAGLISERALRATGKITIAGFSPMGGEASPLTALREAAQSGHTVLLPTFAGDMLGWREWDGLEDLQPSGGAKFGAEPTGKDHGPEGLKDADIIIAPAVALDKSGTRLGHGKGYYDRALVYRNPDAELVALVHRTELFPAGSLPREPHDVVFTKILTEDGLYTLAEG